MSGARLTGLVVRREVREGVRGRTFLVSSIVVLLILGAVVGLPAAIGNPAKRVKVGVVGEPAPALVRALQTAAKPYGATVRLHTYADVAEAGDGVARGKVEVALVPATGTLLVLHGKTGNGVAIAAAATRSVELPQRAARLGVTPEQAARLFAPAVQVREVERSAGGDDSSQFLAYVTSVMLLLALSVYGQVVMMSVVQEKSSRVVEVLLAAVRPRHLLAGKVVGVGLLGLAQIALVAVGAGLAAVTGLIDVPTLGRTAPLIVLWFLLGFAFYAVAFAAVGALVSRLEDASSAATPVTMTMLAAYFATFVVVAGNPDGPGAVFLTLFPPSAPFTLPARVAVTAVPLWQHLASLALMLAGTWGLTRLGGRMYELGLLRTGARVPFREAFASALRR